MKYQAFSHLLVLSFASFLPLTTTSTLSSQSPSKSKDLVIVPPSELPAEAREPGEACFLHSDAAGRTYLYIEQQRGVRMSVLDVTTPARIRLVATVVLDAPAPFDIVSSIDRQSNLVRFRNGHGAGVLDLHNAKSPTIRKLPGLAAAGDAERLGPSTLLVTSQSGLAVTTSAADFTVVDTSATANSAAIATIRQVTSKASNPDTGTTFLLGSDGLTVIRHPSAEYEYVSSKMHASLQ